jgi:hypothetical protein
MQAIHEYVEGDIPRNRPEDYAHFFARIMTEALPAETRDAVVERVREQAAQRIASLDGLAARENLATVDHEFIQWRGAQVLLEAFKDCR